MPDFYRDNRFLVTGGTGFLGSQIVSAFRQRGASVSKPSSLDCDLRDREDVYEMLRFHQPTIVIHAAGNVGGIGYNQSNPATLFYDNLMMGVNLLEACWGCEVVKLVLLGTVCSYPSETPTPFHETDLWNGYPEATNAPYGIAKRTLFTMAQAYRQQFGLNTISLIPTNLYGEGDHFEPSRSHVIPALIRKMVEAKQQNAPNVTVWGSGRATREFLYVKDAAEGICLAAERYNGAEPVNLGSGEEVSILALARSIARTVGYEGELIFDDAKPDGQMKRVLDTSKAEKEFGFTGVTHFEDGLYSTIEWYQREHQPA